MSRIPVAATGAICVAALLAGCSDWSEYNDLRDSPAVTSCIEAVGDELYSQFARDVTDLETSSLALSETSSTPTRTRYRVVGLASVGEVAWAWTCDATVETARGSSIETHVASLERR